MKAFFGVDSDGPEGCSLVPMTWPLMKLIWAIHHDMMPRLKGVLSALEDEKQIVYVSSLRDLQAFISQYG